MQETALRSPIQIELPLYKYFLKGERISKDRIYAQMTTGSVSTGTEGKSEARSDTLERHTAILKNVLFAQRNNPFFVDQAGSSVSADARLQLAITRFNHLIMRQVPAGVLNKQFNGISLESVTIERDKLILRIADCVEAVFSLEFDLPPEFMQPDESGKPRAQYPVLMLYDFRLLLDGL